MQSLEWRQMPHVVEENGYRATIVPDSMNWAVGSIQPDPEHATRESQLELARVVLQSIEEVTSEEWPYTTCTDGRFPKQLASGKPVPTRMQLVGANTLTAFHIAETMGELYYGSDTNAPWDERMGIVMDELIADGRKPSTHPECGGLLGYPTILRNLPRFDKSLDFKNRQKMLSPLENIDTRMRRQVLRGYTKRLNNGAYEDWNADKVVEAVEEVSSSHAIAELNDDGRGVNGHVEEQIYRLHLPNHGINEARVMQETNGREVFGVTDTRMFGLVELFAKGNEQAYHLGHIAAADITDGGHGTLARHLPTYLVTKA